MSRKMKGYLYVIISAVIFGCSPLCAKVLNAVGLNATSIVFFRNAPSLPFLALMVMKSGEGLKTNRTDLLKLVSAGLFQAATMVLLNLSYDTLSSGASTTIHFVYPAIIIVIEVLALRKKLHLRQLLCVLLCTAGVVMFYTPGGGMDPVGAAMALGSGVTFAVYVVMMGHFDLKHISGFKYSFYICSVSAIAATVLCVATDNVAVPTTLGGWIFALFFSLILCVGAVVLLRQGTLAVGSQTAGILSTFEPITSIFVGILVFQDPFGWRTAVGSALIIAASIIVAIGKENE